LAQADLASLSNTIRSLQGARKDADQHLARLGASLKTQSETEAALLRSLESLRNEVQTHVSDLQSANAALQEANATLHEAAASLNESAQRFRDQPRPISNRSTIE
jgi:chromosome segregation ATPase